MKRVNVIIVLVAALAGFSYGFVSGVLRIFPYDLIEKNKDKVFRGTDAERKARVSMFSEFSRDADVVMIGDSIMQNGMWSEFFPGHKISNRGVGGDTSADVIRRFDTVSETKPKISVLMVGINDVYRGVAPHDIAANIGTLIQKLKETGSKVVLHTTLECSRKKCGARLDNVRELNKILTGFPALHGVKLIDLNQPLSDADGLRAKYTFDGVHLNGKGYRVWADLLRAQGVLAGK